MPISLASVRLLTPCELDPAQGATSDVCREYSCPVCEMFMKAPLSESVFTLAVGWTGCTRQSVRSVTSYGQEARFSNPYFPAGIQ